MHSYFSAEAVKSFAIFLRSGENLVPVSPGEIGETSQITHHSACMAWGCLLCHARPNASEASAGAQPVVVAA